MGSEGDVNFSGTSNGRTVLQGLQAQNQNFHFTSGVTHLEMMEALREFYKPSFYGPRLVANKYEAARKMVASFRQFCHDQRIVAGVAGVAGVATISYVASRIQGADERTTYCATILLLVGSVMTLCAKDAAKGAVQESRSPPPAIEALHEDIIRPNMGRPRQVRASITNTPSIMQSSGSDLAKLLRAFNDLRTAFVNAFLGYFRAGVLAIPIYLLYWGLFGTTMSAFIWHSGIAYGAGSRSLVAALAAGFIGFAPVAGCCALCAVVAFSASAFSRANDKILC